MILLSMYPYVPSGYLKLTSEKKKYICNGCGPKFAKIDIIPDSLWGLNITELCNIHDYMYAQGYTETEKKEADCAFLDNMRFHIDLYTKNRILRWLRRGQANKYYWFVVWFGFIAFQKTI